MFRIGEIIVYGTTGVCRIEDITEKSFGATVTRYYILKPVLQKKSTVFVPSENSRLTAKMHHVLSKEAYNEVFSSAISKELKDIDGENERQQFFEEILVNGSREGLVLMVHSLYKLQERQREIGRRLHIADEKLLSSAENILFDEVAYVFGIERDSVPEFVASQFMS